MEGMLLPKLGDRQNQSVSHGFLEALLIAEALPLCWQVVQRGQLTCPKAQKYLLRDPESTLNSMPLHSLRVLLIGKYCSVIPNHGYLDARTKRDLHRFLDVESQILMF